MIQFLCKFNNNKLRRESQQYRRGMKYMIKFIRRSGNGKYGRPCFFFCNTGVLEETGTLPEFYPEVSRKKQVILELGVGWRNRMTREGPSVWMERSGKSCMKYLRSVKRNNRGTGIQI